MKINSILLLLLLPIMACAQGLDSLQLQIESFLKDKRAHVGVAIMPDTGPNFIAINGNDHLPMQSFFKMHISLAMLDAVDRHVYALNSPIDVRKEDLLPGMYSPLRDKYPNGATIPLSEIIHFTIALSDNVGCDLMIKYLGGPQAVENYFSSKGFKDFSVKINEQTMQSAWDEQFKNWTTAIESMHILQAFYKNDQHWLSKESYDFFWKTMRETETGGNRIKGLLPENTVVAHKTGTSGHNEVTGISAATNDAGIVFLPNGHFYIIAVLVSDSKEDEATNERIIAEISALAWKYFTAQ